MRINGERYFNMRFTGTIIGLKYGHFKIIRTGLRKLEHFLSLTIALGIDR